MKNNLENQRDFKLSNLVLLTMVFFLVFFAPLLPLSMQHVVNSTSYTIIFLAAVLSLDNYRKEMFVLALGAIITEWIVDYINAPLFKVISDSINFIFFVIVVFGFLVQLVRSTRIGVLEILESVNGYLMLGLIFSILMTVVFRNMPGAFHFPEEPKTFGDFIYYGFITMSTLGYGDVVPKLPIAKSVAILTTIVGQFYMATIIAIIISKYTPVLRSMDQKEK